MLALALAAALAVPSAADLPVSAADLPVYVALGDSTGVGMGAREGGYPARLAARAARRGHPVRLVNLSVSGARAEDVARGQLDAGLAARPAVVTLGIGINDVLSDTPLDRFAALVGRIAQALAGTGARVVVVAIPDLARSPRAAGDAQRSSVRARTRELNARLLAAARHHGFALADLFGPGAAAYGAEGTLSADLFHPSDAGYDRWADVIAPAFDAALAAGAKAGERGLSPGPALR